MLNTVLVPIDNDACSEFCVHYAFDLARLLGSQVVILHVARNRDRVEAGKALLERLGQGGRFPAKRILMESDQVAETILQVADKHRADLLLLGRCMGDVLVTREGIREQLLEKSPIPVQVVPINMRHKRSFLDRFQPGL